MMSAHSRQALRRQLLGGLLLAPLARLAHADPKTPADTSSPIPAAANTRGMRRVRYYGDQELLLPPRVERIATSWEAQNAIIAMLGAGGSIVATTRFARDMPAFRKLIPGIEHVPLTSSGGGDLNIEALLQLRPEVLFMSSQPAPAQLARLRRAGIQVAALKANSLPNLLERVRISGDIIGPEAVARAQAYQRYFDDNVARVGQALNGLPPGDRVSLYHCMGSPLHTSGRPSLNQDWMDLAQVRNVAEDWFDGHGAAQAPVSIEQILAADPDIIVAMRAADAAHIRQDARWRRLRAVREGKVYANPRGMFWWCRETSEAALQFLWLARQAYPEQMRAIDMRQETHDFYLNFYGYSMNDLELDDVLHPAT